MVIFKFRPEVGCFYVSGVRCHCQSASVMLSIQVSVSPAMPQYKHIQTRTILYARPVPSCTYLTFSQCHSFEYPGPQFAQELLLQHVIHRVSQGHVNGPENGRNMQASVCSSTINVPNRVRFYKGQSDRLIQ